MKKIKQEELEWIDQTPYSEGDVRIPRIWELRYHSLVILLFHQKLPFGPRRWCMTCFNAGLSMHGLKSRDLDHAKLEALRVIKKSLKDKMDEIKAIHALVCKVSIKGKRKNGKENKTGK